MQRYALEVDLAKLGAKRDEAMTPIQKFHEVGQQKFASPPRSWVRKLVETFKPIS